MKTSLTFFVAIMIAIVFGSCGTSNFSRSSQQADILRVQSHVEIEKPLAASEAVLMDVIAPTELVINNQIQSKTEPQTPPAFNSAEKPSHKKVKAEKQQFAREQKKEIRKAILYAFLGKEMPARENAEQGRAPAPFIDRTAAAIIAFFIAPLGAGLYFGKNKITWISLGLFILFWLPGAIYAMIMILRD